MTSDQFRQLRQSLGLTQAELAEIMGIDQQNICRIETERQPTRIQAAFIRYIEKHRAYRQGGIMNKCYGATYETMDNSRFGQITAIFDVTEDWTGAEYHGYHSVPVVLEEMLNSGAIGISDAAFIMNIDINSSAVNVDEIETIGGKPSWVVNIPEGVDAPAWWPEPVSSQCVESGEWWKRYIFSAK